MIRSAPATAQIAGAYELVNKPPRAPTARELEDVLVLPYNAQNHHAIGPAELAQAVVRHQLPTLPGVQTPSEVMQALAHGFGPARSFASFSRRDSPSSPPVWPTSA